MNLESLAQLLEDKSLGSIGKTLFVHEMPLDCKNGIVLIGPPAGVPIDHELPGYRVTEFRLVVRSTEMKRGEQLANDASAVLTVRGDTQIGDLLVKQALPLNDPRPYRRSAGAYWEFEVEIAINYVNNPGG